MAGRRPYNLNTISDIDLAKKVFPDAAGPLITNAVPYGLSSQFHNRASSNLLTRLKCLVVIYNHRIIIMLPDLNTICSSDMLSPSTWKISVRDFLSVLEIVAKRRSISSAMVSRPYSV